MGGTLPVLARLADAEPRRLGRSAGLLYVANTVGAAAGALAVPLVLLPAWARARHTSGRLPGSPAVAAMA